MDKKRLFLITVVLVLVIIIAIVFLLTPNATQQDSQTTTTTTKAVITTTTTTTTKPPQTGIPTEKTSDQPFVDEDGLWSDGFARLNGLYKVKIKNEKSASYHYFRYGEIDNTYIGYSYANDTKDYYYVTKGKIDKTFNGLISISNELHVFKNGKMLKDYNGSISLPNGTFSVVDGAIKDFNYGNSDGYEYKPIFWELDDGTRIINVSKEDFKEG